MMPAPRPIPVPAAVAAAGDSLAQGEPVLLFDAADREGETDLVILSERATPELVRLMRHDGGGLICTAISEELRRRLGLPFFSELLAVAEGAYPVLSGVRQQALRYDRRSAFGITVNHRTNFTGVPDRDRATTIRAVGELAAAARKLDDGPLREKFVAEFTSPGHVPLLYSAPQLLGERKGHTELAISLARMAGLTESATVCEMLGDSGGPRSPDAARRYADSHGFVFLEGRSVLEAWVAWSG
ncbi:MAG: 3,4-dihydroxy-2-butanone-4-phosphate synthase [Thermoplasmata archaeon]|nr:3,4-dihydroxy-2-butanone-4-phosphate synthase [Thermoplasmata archaeon]